MRRLRVLRLRGLTAGAPADPGATGAARPDATDGASFAPVDLDVEAGTLVTVTPGARARLLLDCVQGRREAVDGRIEIAGVPLEHLSKGQRRILRRRSLARVTLDRDGGAPVPVRSRIRSVLTVRDVVRPDGARPGEPLVGPALPLGPLLDRPTTDLDPEDRTLVAIARALVGNADVLLLDTRDVPQDSAEVETLAGRLRDVVDLQGRTVLTATSLPSLVDVAEQVVGLRGSP